MDETSPLPEEPPVSAPSGFVQRYRLYLLVAAVFVLLILFLLLGWQIGRMQKDFDRKALEQRIVLLQKNVQSGRALIEEKKQDLEKSTRDVADKDAQLAKLAEEISTHEGHLQACTASLAAAEKLLHPPVASPAAAAAPEKSRYLRFSNRECTLVSGKGAPQSWRDCVEDAKGKSR